MKISATIITFNEENNIERCLNSLKNIADEIIVVDSYSTDKTRELAQKLGADVHEHAFEGHIQQKNYAMELASYDYVLSLDADEALSDELKSSLQKIKQVDRPVDAYYVSRRNSYCGKWIYHCGWYPDKRIRLWNKKKARWGGVNPHDMVQLDPSLKTQWPKGDLLHYTYHSISEHVLQANKFSEIASLEAYKNGKKTSILNGLVLNPLYTFFQKYFLKRGFLDGLHGLIVCTLSAYSNFLKYSKLRMLNEKKNSSQQS